MSVKFNRVYSIGQTSERRLSVIKVDYRAFLQFQQESFCSAAVTDVYGVDAVSGQKIKEGGP